MIYLGGMSMCAGNAIYKEALWPAFWYAGEWTIAFAIVFYIAGWFRKPYKGYDR